jgi:hypothetical protein
VDALTILGGIGTLLGAATATYSAKRAASVQAAATSERGSTATAVDRLAARLDGRLDEISEGVARLAAFATKIDVRVDRLEKHETGEWTPQPHWRDQTRPGLGPTTLEHKDD